MKQRTINITRNIICILGLLALIILIKPTKVCAFSMNDANHRYLQVNTEQQD